MLDIWNSLRKQLRWVEFFCFEKSPRPQNGLCTIDFFPIISNWTVSLLALWPPASSRSKIDKLFFNMGLVQAWLKSRANTHAITFLKGTTQYWLILFFFPSHQQQGNMLHWQKQSLILISVEQGDNIIYSIIHMSSCWGQSWLAPIQINVNVMLIG